MIAVAAGGALGALLRLWVAQGVHALLGRGFPFGTLVVNVSGSLAMGVVYVLFFERFDIPPEWRAALIVGFLGAFTTFSTFSMDTLLLVQQGEHARAGDECPAERGAVPRRLLARYGHGAAALRGSPC